jgi:AcrR family transcriptional regulator
VLEQILTSRGSPSLHDISRASGASIPTLKHYFGDRSGAIAAALLGVREDATEHFASLSDPGDMPLAQSLVTVAANLAAAWREFGVGALFASGIAAGISDAAAGPAYVNGVLEPTVQAIERRLRVHAERGELCLAQDELPIRTAALAFVSPLLVVLLHQHELSGATCRPLDLPAFLQIHVDGFVRAYGRGPV